MQCVCSRLGPSHELEENRKKREEESVCVRKDTSLMCVAVLFVCAPPGPHTRETLSRTMLVSGGIPLKESVNGVGQIQDQSASG
jgi:hypothetical protein